MKLVLCVAALVSVAFGAPRPRIIGGEDALVGEFPHQISYQWGLLGVFQHICGGSIIAPDWVVTAGHCVTEAPGLGEFQIIAGLTKLGDNDELVQTIAVVEKIVHPDFGGDVGPNDIALLRLGSSLQYNEHVQPINLPEAGAVTTGDVTLSGWGAILDIIIPVMPDNLQKSVLPVVPDDECMTAIDALLEGSDEKNPLVPASNMCTGPLTGGHSACSGDSGGPLIQDNTLVGIVSWGMTPCGSVGAPSVYTKVSSFIDFIDSHVDRSEKN